MGKGAAKPQGCNVLVSPGLKGRFLDQLDPSIDNDLCGYAKLAFDTLVSQLKSGEINFVRESWTVRRVIAQMESEVRKLPVPQQAHGRQAIEKIRRISELNPRLRVVGRGYPQDNPQIELLAFCNVIDGDERLRDELDLQLVIPRVPDEDEQADVDARRGGS